MKFAGTKPGTVGLFPLILFTLALAAKAMSTNAANVQYSPLVTPNGHAGSQPRVRAQSGTSDATISGSRDRWRKVAKSSARVTGELINWQIIAVGGTGGSSTSFRLAGTVDQTAIGLSSSPTYALNQGFWQIFGGASCCITPGDANHDGGVDIADLAYFVDYLFRGGPPPPCPEEFDNNCDCSLDISDLTYFVDYLFLGGPAPCDCHDCPNL